jgi:hypothetical protein
VAAITAAVAGFSFLALPMVSVPFLGSASGTRLASLASQPGAGGFAALWVIPVVAVVVLGLAVRQLLDPPLSAGGRKSTLIPLVVLATVTAVAYVALLVVVQQWMSANGASNSGISAIDVAGVGFWVTLAGLAVAAISGAVELSDGRGVSDSAASPSSPYGSPSGDPARRRRDIAVIAGAGCVILAMVGVTVGDLQRRPGPLAQDVSALHRALEGSSPSSTSGSNDTSAGGDPQTPSSAAPGSSSAGGAAAFVGSYYGLLPGSPDEAWSLLSPEAQAASGGQESFDRFWAGIASVSLENVRTVGLDAVEADIHFTRADGSTTAEHYRLFVSDSGGHQVIQSFSRLGLAGSSSGSSSDQPLVVGIIDLSAVSADSRAPEIGRVLNAYFSGINQRDWSRVLSVVDSQVVDSSDPDQVAKFQQDLSTTNDSNVIVRSIQSSPDSPSGISATVTFQSTQDPRLGPDGQACTLWNLEYLFSGAPGASLYVHGTRGSHEACSPASPSRPPQQLAAPTPLDPPSGSVFSHFPRTTTLSWSAVSGAAQYTVELDINTCGQDQSTWCSDVQPDSFGNAKTTVTGTLHTFDFVGAQPGRWRVHAVDSSGQAGEPCDWQYFTYTR